MSPRVLYPCLVVYSLSHHFNLFLISLHLQLKCVVILDCLLIGPYTSSIYKVQMGAQSGPFQKPGAGPSACQLFGIHVRILLPEVDENWENPLVAYNLHNWHWCCSVPLRAWIFVVLPTTNAANFLNGRPLIHETAFGSIFILLIDNLLKHIVENDSWNKNVDL